MPLRRKIVVTVTAQRYSRRRPTVKLYISYDREPKSDQHGKLNNELTNRLDGSRRYASGRSSWGRGYTSDNYPSFELDFYGNRGEPTPEAWDATKELVEAAVKAASMRFGGITLVSEYEYVGAGMNVGL